MQLLSWPKRLQLSCASDIIVFPWVFLWDLMEKPKWTFWPTQYLKSQQYVNYELPDVQGGFRKGRGTRDQIVNIRWIIEKAKEFQKNICVIDYTKVFDCVDDNKLWKILQKTGVANPLTCLLRNVYADQETTVRIRYGTMDWFKIGKGVCQGCIFNRCINGIWKFTICLW